MHPTSTLFQYTHSYPNLSTHSINNNSTHTLSQHSYIIHHRIVLPICSGYLESFNANGPYCLVVTLLTISGISIIVLRKKIEYCIGDATIGTNIGEKKPALKLRQIFYCIVLLILCIFSILYLFDPPY